jgi:tryptophan-rich sensory protein
MVSPKLGVVVIGAMLTVAAISNRQLKDDDLTNEANFIIVYMVWLSFALSLNLYIASKCAEL